MFHKPMILRHFLPKQDLPAGTNWLSVALDFSHPSKNEKKTQTHSFHDISEVFYTLHVLVFIIIKKYTIFILSILHESYVRD